jgi:alkylation response protein AidB-like acyl-CoA dehydrogenase
VYQPPLADMQFVLDRVAGLPAVARLPGFDESVHEMAPAVLAEAGRLAAEVLAPLNAVGDRHGAVLENGVVRTAPGFREAYRTYAEGGWMGLVFPEEHGGQNLPWLLNTAAAEVWNAANLTFQLCPLLTQAGIEALVHHGTEEQKRLYLPRMVSGEWTGAMCLTEPQAGSDVGALRTRAQPEGDGSYRIRGQKIYITFGEHDLTENIVHMVLARLPGAPEGTKGISLFLVPKFLATGDGSLGRRNDLRCLKLEHKLGINASPTCVISYGDDEEGAVGYLVGEENAGMRCMFTMMNNARLAVGHEGLGLAERAYQAALAYARERTQGRAEGRAARIIDYPDVRRMLLTMRSQIAAMRALCYVVGAEVDRSLREPDPEARRLAGDRVALLTPVVKAWCTDLAQEIARDAVQVHGGMGFVEETGVAQHYRDAKILAIYEGTNGIQAGDLAGRKLTIAGGELPWRLFRELREGDLGAAPADVAPGLARALDALEAATRHLQASDEATRAAVAVPYLRLFGQTVGGFLLARGAAAATAESGRDWPGLARFYVRHLLPPAVGLAEVVLAGGDELDAGLLAA